jgi:hypothetical protein
MATRADEVVPADDSSASFQNHRTQLAQADAGQWLLQRAATATAAAGGAPTPPGSATGGDSSDPSVLQRVGSVAKDVGRGAIETPRAVAGGVRNAAQNTGEFLKQMVDSLADNGVMLPGPQALLTVGARGVQRLGRSEIAVQNFPEIGDPKSTTGRLIKGVAQFLTGFVATRQLPGMSGATSVLGQMTQSAAAGALADTLVWDPHEQRLSDLVQQFPALRNPVTEFLASNPDDSDAMGRFKNALEGIPLGVLTDGLVFGLKTLRSMRLDRLQKAAASGLLPDVADDAVRALDPRELDVLGRPDLPTVAPAGSRKVQRALAETGDALPAEALDDAAGDIFINFRNINTPEDVQNALQGVADAHAKSIDSARRGVQTFADIKLNAEQEDAWSVLMERRMGEPLNAEQSVAARQLWVSSAEKLTELANLAAQSPSEANLFAFRKMLATHHAVQSEVIAARTETARALASWRIPVGGGKEMTRALQVVLAENGGPEVAREMAERITRLSQAGYARELDAFVRGSATARTRDAMMEAWINGLLSGPKTHLVNMISNSSVAFMQTYERGVAAMFNRALGDGGVQAGEAMAQWAGLVDGIRDAFRFAGKSFMTGESTMGIGKVDVPHRAAISSEALGISSQSWVGRFVDTLGHNVARLPTRALAAEDEFFKTIGYRMELHAQAVRQAAADVHAGLIPVDQVKVRVADIISNPPESIRLAAIDQASYQTFTNAPGKLTQHVLKAANEAPAMRILLPFVRTPSNIMRYTFERTPLAPLMSQFRADIAAGGARRDLALARMSTGTAIMFTMADMAMSGNITGGGPASPQERQLLARSGWQQYSVKMGDRWYAYNRLDPIGMLMGMAADMTEVLAYGDQWKDGATADEMVIAGVAAIGNNTMSKTYLSGLSDFFEAMSDPKRHAESYAQRLAGSLVPTGVAEVARQTDPYMREVRSWVDAIRARTPGLSDSLPIRRDVWGRPMTYQSGLGGAYDMVSPIYSRREKPEPIDAELLRLETTISMPNPKTSFDGVTVDLSQYPGAYSRFVELAGNELKHPAWNMGAKDYLNAVVSGRHEMSEVYRIRSDGPDGGKDVFIRNAVNDYRERARRQLLDEYPDLRREVESKQERARSLILAAN